MFAPNSWAGDVTRGRDCETVAVSKPARPTSRPITSNARSRITRNDIPFDSLFDPRPTAGMLLTRRHEDRHVERQRNPGAAGSGAGADRPRAAGRAVPSGNQGLP